MNALKATVKRILSQPRQITTASNRTYWLVDVEYDCHGRLATKEMFFSTIEEADALAVGYEFET